MLDLSDQKRKMLEFKEKDLGVITDHKLNFSSHIVTQVKKANKIMSLSPKQNIFLLLIQFLSQATFRILHFNLVSIYQKR